jgi:hypothetical protein
MGYLYVLEPLGHKLHTNELKTILIMLIYSSFLSFRSFILTHKIIKKYQKYFERCTLLIFNIIILCSNLYNTNDIKKLTQMYKNKNISVFSSFISFVASFQHIKSP